MASPAAEDWTRPAAYTRRSMPRLVRNPADAAGRITLFALRRMGAHGLHDAHAANLMLDTFGLPFRRPLVLLRAVMLELSRHTRRPIQLAPCCCGRMTLDEARLLAAMRHGATDAPRAARHLARLAGQVAPPVLSAAAAYGAALADLGKPLGQ